MVIQIPTKLQLVKPQETEALLAKLAALKYQPRRGFLLAKPVRRK